MLEYVRRRWGIMYFLVCVLAVVLAATAIAERVMLMTPMVRGLLTASVLLSLFTVLGFLFKLFRAKPAFLYPFFLCIALFITWAVLGNKAYDGHDLRVNYVRRMVSYESVPYVKGGETKSGIDDAGLARCGLWQAMLFEGLRQMNPRLLGPQLWRFWWHDVDRQDILKGKNGFTRCVGYSPKLAGYDSFDLEVGDMAVVEDSSEVLIYIDNGKWIEASPKMGRVVIYDAINHPQHSVLQKPVTLVRWWVWTE